MHGPPLGETQAIGAALLAPAPASAGRAPRRACPRWGCWRSAARRGWPRRAPWSAAGRARCRRACAPSRAGGTAPAPPRAPRRVMPMPVSRTRKATSPRSVSAVETITCPPASVNLIALERRLSTICRIERSSATTGGSFGAKLVRITMRSRAACGCISVDAVAATSSLRLTLAKDELHAARPRSWRGRGGR